MTKLDQTNQVLRQLKHIYTPAFWLIAIISMYLRITPGVDLNVYGFLKIEIIKSYHYLGIIALGPAFAAIAEFNQDFETGIFRRKIGLSLSRRIYITKKIHNIYLHTILRIFIADLAAILVADKALHFLIKSEGTAMFMLLLVCNIIEELCFISVILLLTMYIQSTLYSQLNVVTLYLVGIVFLHITGQITTYSFGRWLVFPFLYALKSENYTYKYLFVQLGLSLAITVIVTFILFKLFQKKDFSIRNKKK